jgi:hypothetical protein
MTLTREAQIPVRKKDDDDTNDPTAPFNELESFDSIWQALRWKQIRTRVPICLRKTIRNRYMLANLVYLGYAIGILIIDYNPTVNGSSSTDTVTDVTDITTQTMNTTIATTTAILDQPIVAVPLVNRLYLGKQN